MIAMNIMKTKSEKSMVIGKLYHILLLGSIVFLIILLVSCSGERAKNDESTNSKALVSSNSTLTELKEDDINEYRIAFTKAKSSYSTLLIINDKDVEVLFGEHKNYFTVDDVLPKPKITKHTTIKAETAQKLKSCVVNIVNDDKSNRPLGQDCWDIVVGTGTTSIAYTNIGDKYPYSALFDISQKVVKSVGLSLHNN